MPSPDLHINLVDSLAAISPDTWQSKSTDAPPFCQYGFLRALEDNGCVGGDSGWHPQHAEIYQGKHLLGYLPLYQKQHSYGEYVFDFSWADAYQRHGLAYYPKLLAAVPFTPVTSSKLLSGKSPLTADLLCQVQQALQQHCQQQQTSSLHCLFTPLAFSKQLAQGGWPQRLSVQFEWQNRDYQHFDDFLAHLTSRKRKNLRKERQQLQAQGVSCQRLSGNAITPAHLAFFYQCYQQTYLKLSGHQGYLNVAFFQQLLDTMPEHVMLCMAYADNKPIASALYLFDQNGLYGRYWGALAEHNGLHFEVCYYQGIEFCIEQKIARFNPGTQGEHKLIRGFEPVFCYSNHWLAEPAFHQAVADFTRQEQTHMQAYYQQAQALLPFKQQ